MTIVVIVPQPKDLTPADTSSYDKPALAEAIRAYHDRVDEIVIPIDPGEADVAALADRVAGAALVIVGTINAISASGQVALINTLIDRGQAVIAIALRMPYDVSAYSARADVCVHVQPAACFAGSSRESIVGTDHRTRTIAGESALNQVDWQR